MKLTPKITIQKNRIRRKQRISNIYYKIVGFVLARPLIFLEKQMKNYTKNRMLNNTHLYKKKSANEVVKYIQSRLSSPYGISISIGSLSSHYSDDEADITLTEFIGYGFRPRKYNRLSEKFYINVLSNNKNRDETYTEIMVLVLENFKQFEDVQVTRKETRDNKEYYLIKHENEILK